MTSKLGGSISYETTILNVGVLGYEILGPKAVGIGLQPFYDINSMGLVVGTLGRDAAFVGTVAQVEQLQGANLNSEISNALGVQLSLAFKIDDLGDILAEGTLNGNDQYFLLTPNGSPTPAPEPSTLALMAVGVTALGIRSAHRRRGRLCVAAA